MVLALVIDDHATAMEPRAETRQRLLEVIDAVSEPDTRNEDRLRAEWGRSAEQIAMLEAMPDRIG